MTLLAIETSGLVCSAALLVGGVPVCTRAEAGGANHARLLPRFVDELLAEARTRRLSLEAVALSEGPGSYTGLRIGSSMAKGLCYGLGIPLIAIPTPLVLCASYAAHIGRQPADAPSLPADPLLCPMTDARRMEVYTALYTPDLRPVMPIQACVIDASSFAERLAQSPVVFFGDGADKCRSVICSPAARFVSGILPDAQHMGVLAEAGYGRTVSGKDIAYYNPFYLKDFVAAPSHVKGLHP